MFTIFHQIWQVPGATVDMVVIDRDQELLLAATPD